jgi:hypothetical protein
MVFILIVFDEDVLHKEKKKLTIHNQLFILLCLNFKETWVIQLSGDRNMCATFGIACQQSLTFHGLLEKYLLFYPGPHCLQLTLNGNCKDDRVAQNKNNLLQVYSGITSPLQSRQISRLYRSDHIRYDIPQKIYSCHLFHQS